MSMSTNVHLPNPRFNDAATFVGARTRINDDGDVYGVLQVRTSSSDGVDVALFVKTPEQVEILRAALDDIADGLRLHREVEAHFTADPVRSPLPF